MIAIAFKGGISFEKYGISLLESYSIDNNS